MVVRMANVSNSNNICDNVVVDDDDVTLIFHPIFFSVKL